MELLIVPLIVLVLASPILAIAALAMAARLKRRIETVERELAWRPRASGAPEPFAPSPAPVERPAPPAPPVVPAPRPEAEIPSFSAAIPPRAARDERRDLEVAIGTRWFNIAGIVTLLFGVAFFLKYAYENAWIGPRGRVAIGVLCGVVAIVIGEMTRRRGHVVFAQGLAGGGIATLYLSFFFSFRLYHLIEIAPAFALMAAVVACGVALAIVQDSLAVALLSFAGAYLTPVLLSTGADAAEFLFAYLAVLACGALAVTRFKRWRALDLVAFACTGALYAGWFERHYAPHRMPVALLGLAVFFAIFLLLPYGHALARRVASTVSDHVLSVANAAFAFGFAYRLLHPAHPRVLGFVALGLAGCYLALGSAARRRHAADRGLAVALLGLAITCLTLAIPLQLGLHGITLAWAIQGVLLLHLGFRHDARLTRLAGVAVVGLAVARLFLRHLPLHREPFRLFWNEAFGTWAFVLAALFAAAWLCRRGRARLRPEEETLPSALLVAWAFLLMFALHSETHLFGRLWGLDADARAALTMAVWALVPPALALLARALQDRALRLASLAIAAGAVVPYARLLERVAAAYDPLASSLVFWIGAAGAASFYSIALVERGGRLETAIPWSRACAGIGVFLLLALLTVELHSHFRLEPGSPEDAARNGLRALLSVSVLWALSAALLMAIGFRRSDRHCRIGAAALFLITLLKVFLVDVWELREGYRILSFIVLGLVLVIASFAYSRLRPRVAAAGIAAALALGTPGDLLADFDATRWEARRAVAVSGGEAADGAEAFAWLALDAGVLAASRADLADLRVVAASGDEVPYVVVTRRAGTRSAFHAPPMLNRATLPGGAAVGEVDFGGKTVRNRLRVETDGDDFRRRVRVEGSDDGKRWATLVEGASVHAVPASGALAAARFEEITLPDTDHRRLRVTVLRAPGERGPVRLRALAARRESPVEGETRPARVASSVTRDARDGTTVIEVDFGHRNARPASLRLDFEEAAFRRAFRLDARDERTITLRSGPAESGEPIVREAEAPWRHVAAGTLLRLPAGRAGEAPVDDTLITLPEITARYVRLVVADHDDRPLRLRAVEARTQVVRVVFPLTGGNRRALYYGNPAASRPSYDLAALLPREIDALHALDATLGEPEANPRFGARPGLPFTERHPWILWAALLAGAATLGAVALRGARRAGSPGAA